MSAILFPFLVIIEKPIFMVAMHMPDFRKPIKSDCRPVAAKLLYKTYFIVIT